MAEKKEKPKKQAYDYIVLDTEKEEIVQDGRVMAENPNKALTSVCVRLSAPLAKRIDDLEIQIRPF